MPDGSKLERSTKAGAGAVAGTGGLATLVVWLLGKAGVSLSAEAGSIIAGALSAVTLFIWHTPASRTFSKVCGPARGTTWPPASSCSLGRARDLGLWSTALTT